MTNYWLWSISVMASMSGLTVPETLHQGMYLAPVYTSANTVALQQLPTTHLLPPPQKRNHDMGPELVSSSALILDDATGAVLWEKEAHKKSSIASITKLITTLVALDHINDWKATYEFKSDENALIGARVAAGNGDAFTKEDILHGTLIASANNAALALARSTGLSDEEFVEAMNAKAQELGMKDSSFVEPTGLEEENMSTANDVAILMRSIAHHPKLLEIMEQKEYTMHRQNGSEENRAIIIHTTNRLIKNDIPMIIGGKTGFTYEAGYCLVSLGENTAEQRIIVALLGAPDETTRFDENAELVHWAYDQYMWPGR